MRLNLDVCLLFVIWLCLWALLGSTDSLDVKINIETDIDLTKSEQNYYNIFIDKELNKPLLWECHNNVKHDGKIKWFQIKDGLHQLLQSKSYTGSENSIMKFGKQLSKQDYNTKIYCLFQPHGMNNMCEIISQDIGLKSGQKQQEPNPKVTIQIRPRGANTFDIMCTANTMPQPSNTILEVYKLKGSTATLLNSEKQDTKNFMEKITLHNITICDNYAMVYCRAVINGSTENFYRSPMKPINGTRQTEETCNELEKCQINLIPSIQFETPEDYTGKNIDPFFETIIITVCSSVIFIILVILIIYLCVKRRQKLRKLTENEPKVLYAEIELSHHSGFDKQKRQETPYAEIVGVLKPANDYSSVAKPSGTATEDSPYATPYTSHYAQIIMNNIINKKHNRR